MRERNNRSRPVNAKRRERNLPAFRVFRLYRNDLRRCPRRPRALCFEIENQHPERNHDGTLYVLFTGVRAIFPVR